MKTRELVKGLKGLKKAYPVVLMKGNEILGLGSDFGKDKTAKDRFNFIVRNQQDHLLDADTELLKNILDYYAKKEFRSLFSDETPFEEFEIVASKKEKDGSFSTVNILKCGVEKINDQEVFALHVDKLFEKDKN